jgi:hypothetical protein
VKCPQVAQDSESRNQPAINQPLQGFSIMQSLLSFALDAIVCASVVYFSVGFVLGAVERSPRPVPPTAAELTADFQALVSAAELTIDVDVIPDSCPALPLPQAQPAAKPIAPTAADLRKQCTQRGITWRNAHGKHKHLSAKEMKKKLASVT